jgi:hypothetical protein
MMWMKVSASARRVVARCERISARGGRFGLFAGLAVIALLSLLLLVTHGASVAGAQTVVTCTPTTPGPTGVLTVSASGTPSSGDSISVVANSGNVSVSLNSGGSTQVCTYPDSGASGYPTVDISGSTSVPTTFVVGTDIQDR